MRYPLHHACRENGDLHQVVVQVEEAGVNPDEPDDEFSRTPLQFAVEFKHFRICAYLLSLTAKDGVDGGQKTSSGWTLLHLCVRQGAFDILQLLLEGPQASRTKAVVDAQNALGHTPLHVAIQFAPRGTRLELVQLLLAHGASASLVDSFGISPSRLAASTSQPALVSVLLASIPVPCPPRQRPSRLIKATTEARAPRHR